MSSFVSVNPGSFGAAAQDLTGIGSAIRSANSAAAASTTQVAVAAQDEVSAVIAGVFGSHAQGYQTVAAQAAAFHDLFTGNLLSGANSYGSTEAPPTPRRCATWTFRFRRTTFTLMCLMI